MEALWDDSKRQRCPDTVPALATVWRQPHERSSTRTAQLSPSQILILEYIWVCVCVCVCVCVYTHTYLYNFKLKKHIQFSNLKISAKLQLCLHSSKQLICTLVLSSAPHLVGASSHKLKGHGLDSRSRHMPRSQVLSPAGVHTKDNQSMFLFHINMSLSLPSPLSKTNKHVLKWGFKKE